MLLIYRFGSHVPVPGVNLSAVNNIQKEFGGSNILGLLNLFSGGGLSKLAIFALGIMPYITSSIILQLLQVAVPSLEKLSKEGEVGQAEDHPVHPLPDRRPGLRPVDRLRVPVPHAAGQSGRIGGPQLQRPPHLPDRGVPDGRLHPADVDRRADHPARHRQRHLAADLRLDRLPPAGRHPGLVDDQRPGLQGDDAVPRAGRGGRDRVRPGRPAPDPRPVRQARDRTADVRGRADLPAPAREHGRRDPGDLRRQPDGASRRPSGSS